MAAPLECRDIRSASLPFKRDRDHNQKWVRGTRPSSGVFMRFEPALDDPSGGLIGGNEGQRAKVRPCKQYSQVSHHSEKYFYGGMYSGPDAMRVRRLADARDDAREHEGSSLSHSLLDLVPQHNNATNSSVQTVVLANSDNDASILYSYENKVSSPGPNGRQIDLGGLVELAEKKWVNEQTEKIVHGEYEVLDNEGETILTKGKGKKSPKQRAVKATPAETENVIEVDGFELI
ncbi:hypothetical protein B7463_g11960, partial [Scytalidium lignicola]